MKHDHHELMRLIKTDLAPTLIKCAHQQDDDGVTTAMVRAVMYDSDECPVPCATFGLTVAIIDIYYTHFFGRVPFGSRPTIEVDFRAWQPQHAQPCGDSNCAECFYVLWMPSIIETRGAGDLDGFQDLFDRAYVRADYHGIGLPSLARSIGYVLANIPAGAVKQGGY